jgi:hypothetical protein
MPRNKIAKISFEFNSFRRIVSKQAEASKNDNNIAVENRERGFFCK